MKKYFIYLLFFAANTSYAQDQLFKKDNSKVEVKILEINQNEIKYKLFTYQDGPTIIIAKKDVALIIYQNGVHEVLNATPEVVPEQTTTAPIIVYNNAYRGPRVNQDSLDKAAFKNLTSNKHLISFNMLEPLNGSFGLSYLSEFANNYINVYVPVSVGFANPYFTQQTNSLFSGGYNNNTTTYNVSNFKFTSKAIEAGLGVHFQTSGKHAVTHFIGPYVGMAQFIGSYDEQKNTYINNIYTNNTISRSFTMNRLYVLLDNGFLFRATENFNIILLAGVGYHIDTYKTNDPTAANNFNTNPFPINAFKFGLSFGYRF